MNCKKNEFTRIGLGLSQLNNNLYLKKKFTLKKIDYLINYSIEKGINVFDTAHNYGDTEKALGYLSKYKKNNIKIFTKIGLTDEGKRNFTTSFMMKRIYSSIKNLKVDFIDTLFLNKPTKLDIEKNDIFNFIYKIRKKGLVKNFGIVVGNQDLPKYIFEFEGIKFFSFLYNLLNIDEERNICFAKKKNKIVITRSPFNAGLLSNKFSKNLEYSSDDFRYNYFSGKNFELKKKKKL